METKVCKCCGRELPISEFRTTKIGRLNTCNEYITSHQIQAKADKKMKKMAGDELEKAKRARLSDFTIREWNGMFIVNYHYCEIPMPDTQIVGISWVHELQHFLRLCGIEKEIQL